MKEAMASNVEGRGLGRKDAIDDGRGRLERKRESSNFFTKHWKKNGSCLLWCMMERIVRRDNGNEFC